MSSSVDNNSKKAPKKKGIIRTGAVGPAILAGVGLFLYFTLLFDWQLKMAIEYAATHALGAEVDVGRVRTSFLHGTFLMERLQVTDADHPDRNVIEIGRIQFAFSWDAALRAKLVIPIASVQDFQTGTPRSRPGRVIPFAEDEEGNTSWRKKLVDRARDEYAGTGLADAGKILQGFNPADQLKDIGTLESKKKIEALSSSLDQKQGEWNASVKAMPGPEELTGLKARILAVPTTPTQNPAEIAQRVQQAQAVLNDANTKVAETQSKATAISSDVQGFGKSVGEVDQWIAKDRRTLESKLKIPSLDASSLTQQLMGPRIVAQIAKVQKWIAMGRSYMPAGGDDADKSKPDPGVMPPKRGAGRTYEFGRVGVYPRYWLKRAELSSRADGSPFGGNVVGEALDFSSQPRLTGRPASVRVRADFPRPRVNGVAADLVLDHTQKVNSDSIRAEVSGFPVSDRVLSESEDLTFKMKEAIGGASINGVLKGDEIQLDLEGRFQKAVYEVRAKSELLGSLIQDALKNVGVVKVTAQVRGQWDNLAITMKSNLAEALQSAIAKKLAAQLAGARKKLDEMIQAQLGDSRAKLEAKYKAAQAALMKLVEERKAQAQAVADQATAKVNELKNQAAQAQRAIEDRARQAIPPAVKPKLPF